MNVENVSWWREKTRVYSDQTQHGHRVFSELVSNSAAFPIFNLISIYRESEAADRGGFNGGVRQRRFGFLRRRSRATVPPPPVRMRSCRSEMPLPCRMRRPPPPRRGRVLDVGGGGFLGEGQGVRGQGVGVMVEGLEVRGYRG